MCIKVFQAQKNRLFRHMLDHATKIRGCLSCYSEKINIFFNTTSLETEENTIHRKKINSNKNVDDYIYVVIRLLEFKFC